MSNIQWNQVTWYSWVVAIVLYVGTFALAFYLGTLWSSAHAAPVSMGSPAAASTTAANMPGATATSSASLVQQYVITQQQNNSTVQLSVDQPFAVELGSSLSWSLQFSPAGLVKHVATSTSSTTQGVFVAHQPGTVNLIAEGRPICQKGQMCPQFITQDHFTLLIS